MEWGWGVVNPIGMVVSELPIRRCWRARKIGVEFEGIRWIMHSLMQHTRRKRKGREEKGRLHSRKRETRPAVGGADETNASEPEF